MLPDPLLNIYQAMQELGYKQDHYEKWKERVKLFFMAGEGGLAFVEDEHEPGLWWLDVYCPNERPSDNTVRFLMGIAFASGCQIIASQVKRAGSGQMLRKVGFKEIDKQLYTIRAY